MSLLNESGAGQQQTAAQTTDNSTSTQSTNNQSTSTGTWHDKLPEDLRDNATLKHFKSEADLAKSYVHAQSMIGKKGVIVPSEKSSSDEWNQFYKDIGVPEKDKYEIKLTEGKKYDQDFLTKFKELAATNGILPKQAEKIVDFYVAQEESAALAKAANTAKDQEVKLATLKKEWGEGFDKQLALAKLGVRDVGGEEFAKYLEESGIGNDIQMIKLMAKVGAVLGEDKLRGDGSGKFGKTPDEIKREIAELTNHPAYADKLHGDHVKINNKMSDLYKTLYS